MPPHWTTPSLERFCDDADRALLDFDVRRLDWTTSIRDAHTPGLRRHVLRDRAGAGAPLEAAVT